MRASFQHVLNPHIDVDLLDVACFRCLGLLRVNLGKHVLNRGSSFIMNILLVFGVVIKDPLFVLEAQMVPSLEPLDQLII